MLFIDPRYFNNTNAMPMNLFKETFASDMRHDGFTYPHSADIKTILDKIEKNASSVSVSTATQYINRNLSIYSQVNRTVHLYVDVLVDNNGSSISLPQVPMHEKGDDGEGAYLDHNGAYYDLNNTYEFEDDLISKDVNESDPSHPYHWIYSSGGPNLDSETVSMTTLCRRTANSTNESAPGAGDATNATYECNQGTGNITANWAIHGKDIDMDWTTP
jgi:hypothetical protein